MGERRLAMLSRRVQLLTAALPDATTVYGLFLTKGPALQGSHYRCANAPPHPPPTPLTLTHTHTYICIYIYAHAHTCVLCTIVGRGSCVLLLFARCGRTSLYYPTYVIFFGSAAIRVLDIVVADQDPIIVQSIQALTVWHSCINRATFTSADIERLRDATAHMLQQLRSFEGVGISQKLPKLHRLRDYPDVIRTFGGARFVTTDMYEMAHKALKVVMSR